MYIRVIGKDMEFFNNKDVILFGGGSCGLRALEEFIKAGARIIAFCDNNKALAGSQLNGYPIISPEQLYDFPETAIIITSTYEEEIKKQLTAMRLFNFYCIKLGVLRETIEKENFKNKLLSDHQVNQLIYERLQSSEKFFVGRLGSVELECLSHYLYFLNRKENSNLPYPENVKMMMNVNAGFFPSEDRLLDQFSKLYMNKLAEMDVIWSMWFSKYEDNLYNDFFADKCIADYDNTVFPYKEKTPWTLALEGKRILVIHPFEESIKENYQNRNLIFPKKCILPDFDLITLKAVQSIAGNTTTYKDWFHALNDMEDQMAKIDFDIALIGAGAYGLPLGAFAKELGKKALHIGGILQLFFGIKGKAWNKLGIYNEHWTSPKQCETPMDFKKVEAGRYW
ncbi:MAG: hypothetical protein QM644_09155 [Mobilitalea sp.]